MSVPSVVMSCLVLKQSTSITHHGLHLQRQSMMIVCLKKMKLSLNRAAKPKLWRYIDNLKVWYSVPACFLQEFMSVPSVVMSCLVLKQSTSITHHGLHLQRQSMMIVCLKKMKLSLNRAAKPKLWRYIDNLKVWYSVPACYKNYWKAPTHTIIRDLKQGWRQRQWKLR